MRIRDSRDEPHFPEKEKLLSSQIQTNTLFKNNKEIKTRIFDRNIHKAIQIPVNIYQTNKIFFATVQPKKPFKLEYAGHLWLPFLDNPQSDIVVFANNYFSDI